MAFSGQRIYENWLYSLFNVFFASWPIIIYGLFDQEFNDYSLMEYPFLYEKGMRDVKFNPCRFLLWLFGAIWQSVIIGMLSIEYMESNFVTFDGRTTDLWGSGALILGICVMIANLKILTFSYIHSLTGYFFVFGSIAVYVISFVVVNALSTSDLYERFSDLWTIPNFYFGHIVILIATTGMDLVVERYYNLIERKILRKRKKEYDIETKPYLKDILLGQNAPKVKIRVDTEIAPIKAQNLNRLETKGYQHSGYAFSQEDHYNWLNIQKGIQNPDHNKHYHN